jgi:NAD+ diphosphatase
MIQDIAPHIFNNHFVYVTEVAPEDYLLYFRENKLMLKKDDDEPDIPQKKDLPDLPSPGEIIYLFSLNDRNCFLLKEFPNPDPDKFVFEEINFFRTLKKKEVAWISVVGNQLMNWYSLNQYCGRCGHKTTLTTHERAITCNNCHTTVYPKISPAIIVEITCGDKILLAQGRNFRSSFYSLVAGYADIGESLEDAVRREVMEEVGIAVTNIRYYKSQPWPFSGSMMIGYWAEADASRPIRIDETEIIDAQWFIRGDLPNHPTNISIAGEMIDEFEKAKC